MEEHLFSIPICEGVINDYLLPKVYTTSGPDTRAIATYSLQKSAALTESLVVSEDYCPDQPKVRLSEEQPFVNTHTKSIRINQPTRLPNHPKLSIFSNFSRGSKQSKAREDPVQVLTPFNNPKLTPLQTCEDSDHSQNESQDLQTRLRERKIHQHYFRTRYEQNFKQGVAKKKPGFNGKNQGKGHNVIAYDFDGGIIQSNGPKQEGVKLPLHFLDLEVHVVEREEERDPKKKLSKPKYQPKRQSIALKREEIKPAESHFFKDLNGIRWNQGVQLRHSKQECRKILGYQNPNILRKRKIDLFKHNDQPVHIKFQDLASYKNLASSNSQIFLSQQNLHSRQSEQTILTHNNNTTFFNAQSKSKYITVTNSRALQFLIEQQQYQEQKKSKFGSTAKKVGRSLHVPY